MLGGADTNVRVNAMPCVTASTFVHASSVPDGAPAIVIVVSTTAVYTQCPKALIRSRLWDPAQHRDPTEVPSVGQIMERITDGDIDGAALDAAYPERVRQTIY